MYFAKVVIYQLINCGTCDIFYRYICQVTRWVSLYYMLHKMMHKMFSTRQCLAFSCLYYVNQINHKIIYHWFRVQSIQEPGSKRFYHLNYKPSLLSTNNKTCENNTFWSKNSPRYFFFLSWKYFRDFFLIIGMNY